MPNWCSNSITITGPADQMKTLWGKAQDNWKNGNYGLLNAMVPMPAELKETEANGTERPNLVEKYGHNDWYGWCNSNWGTKWDISDEGLEFEDTEDGYATISGWFESAWAPPIDAYNTFLENNEEMSIRANYEEGGMDFAGIYEDGDDEYLDGLSEACEKIVRGTETLEEQDELFKRLDEEFELVENRREYIEEQMEEEKQTETA